MKDENKTKAGLIKELKTLRKEREKSALNEITGRKRVEEEQGLYAAMMKNVAEGIYLIGLDDLRIKWTNERFARMFGYDLGEMVGKKVDIVNAPTEKTPTETRISIADILKKTGEWHGEVKNIKRDGTHFWCYANVSLFDHPEYGKILVAAHTDITERKKAEEELQESEEKFRTLVTNTEGIVYMIAKDGTILLSEGKGLSKIGAKAGQNVGKSVFKQYKDYPDILEKIRKAFNGESVTAEVNIGGVYFRNWYTPHINNKGEIIGLLGLSVNITERKKALEEIEKLAKFPTENPNPVLRISKEGTVLFHNYASESLLRHWHYKEGKPLQDRWFQFVLDALYDDDIKTVDTEIGDKVVSLTFAPIVEKDFVNVYGLDITERKQAEEELTKYRKHLEELVKERTTELEEKTKTLEKSQQSLASLLEDVNEAKAKLENVNKKLETSNKELEAFSYSVSHDLRAPLRAIDGFTRILMENYIAKLDAEGKRLGGIIQQNTKKMGQLIDDLLAFSHMGRASMSFSEIDMKKMANAIYYEATNAEVRKRITFTMADLSKAKGDTNMMRQVWMNFISNTIKFSAHRKQAVISVSCQEEENKLTYCIKDNGVGFNMKYKDKLFGVFQRLHSEKEFEGTGLGLALVQRIIHRHGGEVWASGEVDNGAAFYFSLPKNRRI